jgi:hypothetical protein
MLSCQDTLHDVVGRTSLCSTESPSISLHLSDCHYLLLTCCCCCRPNHSLSPSNNHSHPPLCPHLSSSSLSISPSSSSLSLYISLSISSLFLSLSLFLPASLSRAPHPREARLFQASTATGSFKVVEVANYDQSDLIAGNRHTHHDITSYYMA